MGRKESNQTNKQNLCKILYFSLFEKYGLESPITYANWMAYGIPTSFVLVIFVWIWLQVYFLRSL